MKHKKSYPEIGSTSRWVVMVFLKQMLDKIGFREQIEKCESLPVSLSNNSYKKEVLLESFITSIEPLLLELILKK